jgi:AcrR family transcriptional regulator
MIAGALALIDEGGLKALTVDTLATRAATSNGAIYHRFGSRDGLVTATAHEFLHAFEASVMGVIEGLDDVNDDAVAASRLVAGFLDAFDEHRLRFRAMMIEGRDEEALAELGIATSHKIAMRMSAWLQQRYGCAAEVAEACFQVVFGLAAARALWEDDHMSANPPPAEVVSGAAARAVLAIVAPNSLN